MVGNNNNNARAKELKKSIISNHKKMMNNVCVMLYGDYQENKNKIPHGVFLRIVKAHERAYPRMKKSMLKMAFSRYKQNIEKAAAIALVSISITNTVSSTEPSSGSIPDTVLVNDEDSLSASTLSNVSEQVELQKKGGRPVGTTIIAKGMLDKCFVVAKNEVTMKYKAALEEAREKGKNVSDIR